MGLKLKDKGNTKFYECCDLTKKVYLMYIFGIVCTYQVNTKFVEIHTQSWRVLKFLLQVGFLLYFLISRSLPTTAGVKLQH